MEQFLGRLLSDTAASFDSVGRTYQGIRLIGEAVSSSDLVSRVTAFLRNFTDQIAALVSLSAQSLLTRTLRDAVSAVTEPAANALFPRQIVEHKAVQDFTQATAGFFRAFSERVQPSNIVSAASRLSRQMAESIQSLEQSSTQAFGIFTGILGKWLKGPPNGLIPAVTEIIEFLSARSNNVFESRAVITALVTLPIDPSLVPGREVKYTLVNDRGDLVVERKVAISTLPDGTPYVDLKIALSEPGTYSLSLRAPEDENQLVIAKVDYHVTWYDLHAFNIVALTVLGLPGLFLAPKLGPVLRLRRNLMRRWQIPITAFFTISLTILGASLFIAPSSTLQLPAAAAVIRLFTLAVGITVYTIAIRGFSETGDSRVLALAGGFLAAGLFEFATGVTEMGLSESTPAQRDLALAYWYASKSIITLPGILGLFLRRSPLPQRQRIGLSKLARYLFSIGPLIVIVALATSAWPVPMLSLSTGGMTIPGYGLAFAALTLTSGNAFLLLRGFANSRNMVLYWFATGFVTLIPAEIGLMLSADPWSLTAWSTRVGDVLAFGAILLAIREARRSNS